MLKAFLKKNSGERLGEQALSPAPLITSALVSREEPIPKFFPATRPIPGSDLFREIGSISHYMLGQFLDIGIWNLNGRKDEIGVYIVSQVDCFLVLPRLYLPSHMFLTPL
jgi:hypothetical protein